jgi:hypothetical protein
LSRFIDRSKLAERLARDARQEGECIVWTGCTAQGYGRLTFQGRGYLTHRAAYEIARGPVPKGMTLDHLCRNRACMNPDHLEPVTRGENVRRGVPFREHRTVCLHGHEMTSENTRMVRDRGREYPICVECRRRTAREYQRRTYQPRREVAA